MPTDREILDDFELEIRSSRQKTDRRNKYLSILSHPYISRFGRPILLFAFIYSVYCLIISAPSYAAAQTAENGQRFIKIIESQGGVYRENLLRAMELLKEQPAFYAKVVNNVKGIEINASKCGSPYIPACVKSLQRSDDTLMDMIFYRGTTDKIVIISPAFQKIFTAQDLALLLLHESDHMEMFQSSTIRRVLLTIFECSPALNPGISIDSKISDMSHRVDAIEICAEKAEEKFLEESDLPSKYSVSCGALCNFFGAMNEALLQVIRLVRYI